MHTKRWLTGIISLALVIYIIGFGYPWLFVLLLCLISFAGLIEFYGMALPNLSGSVRWLIYLSAFLLFVIIYIRQILFLPVIILFWAFVPMVFFALSRPSGEGKNTEEIGKLVLGPVYVVLPLTMILDIYLHYQKGKFWILFLLAVIIANDTGAFYFGRLFGRHKLYKALSPGKTWEGALGGLISGIIIALWFFHLLRLRPLDLEAMVLALVLSVTGQMGDLLQSMLKRDHGVKDSGKMLPGHGGILDRIDSVLFAIPVLFVFLNCSI